MTLLACGLNHRTAPLSLREKLAFPVEAMGNCLRDLSSHEPVQEAVILSTCNRTELYCDSASSPEVLVQWLMQQSHLMLCDLLPHLYFYHQDKAVQHMMRVASGLDSMILGEPQILGQMKNAYTLAKESGTLGGQLQRLFQHVFSVTKRIRTDTEIGANSVSVSFAAVDLAKRIFGDLKQANVLLIGAGETTQLVGRYLFQEGVKQIVVANRTAEKATELAQQFAGQGIALGDIPDHLATADIIVTATASQLPILGKGAVERALKLRKHRPMFMLDLAVPRDIEAEVESLRDVFLYSIDDLKDVVQQNKKHRQSAAEQAETIVQQETQHFMGQLRSLAVVDTIRDYRQSMQKLRDEQLEKALQRLHAGESAEIVVQELARLLTNKFMHEPCVQMKQAGYHGDEEFLASARRLLKLR